MLKFIPLLALIITIDHSYSQTENLVDLIISSVRINESNPTHLEEADRLNNQFKELLLKSENNDQTSVTEQFAILNRSVQLQFEDEVDKRRNQMTLCLNWAIIALQSGKEKFDYYIDLAKRSISDQEGRSVEFLESQYCGLDLLRIYLKSNLQKDNFVELEELKKDLELYKSNLEDEFYNDALNLIAGFEK